jgi:hypothetical protein
MLKEYEQSLNRENNSYVQEILEKNVPTNFKISNESKKVKWLDDAAATVSNSYYNKSKGWGQTASELPSLGNNPIVTKRMPTADIKMSEF